MQTLFSLFLQLLSTPSLNNNQLFNNHINNNDFLLTNENAAGGFSSLQTVSQNQQQDSYGTPQGNVITGTNIGGVVGNAGNVDPGLTNNNLVSAQLNFPNQQSSNNPFLSNNNNNNLLRG